MQQLRTLTLSFALLALTSACAGGMNNPAALENRFKANQEVKDTLNKVGPEVPTLNEALLKSARDAEKSGNYSNAVNFYAQLVEKEPQNKEYLLGISDALRKSGLYVPAIKNYEKIVINEDVNYKLAGLEGIGLSLMAMGEYEQAGDKLSEVMEIDGTRWRTVNAIGILFTIREMYDEARQYFEEARTLQANNASVLNNYALMEAMAKEYDASLRLFKDAASAAPRDSSELRQVELNEALVHAIKGDVEQAKKLAGKHLSETQLLNNMGYYSYLADDEKMAKSYLNMALTNSPKHYDKAWQNLSALDKLAGRKASDKKN